MKILLLTVFVFLLSAINAGGTKQRRSKIDSKSVWELMNYLKQVLENFRSEMKSGVPELSISSLDPLPVEDKYFEFNEAMAVGQLSLNELSVEGLSTMQPIIRPPLDENLHVRFDLSTVTASGHYDVEGKVAKIFPVYGKGPFTITLDDPTAEVLGYFYLERSRVYLEITDMTFDWRKLHLNLENFLGGGELSAVVQRVIPLFARQIFEHIEPDMVEHIKSPLNQRINREIANPDIQKILKMLLNVK